MPLGRSDAGLECLSDCRASVVQRLRTFSRAQHVVSTIICWCSHSSDVGGDFGVKQGEFFAEQLLQPAHEPYRIPAPSRAAFAVAERVFPVLWRAWYRNADATPLSPVAAGNQVLALLPVAFVSYGTNLPDTWRQACVYVGRILKDEKPSELPVVRQENSASRPRQRCSARRRGDRVRQNLCSA